MRNRSSKVYIVGYMVRGHLTPLVIELDPMDAAKTCGLLKKEDKFLEENLKVYWTFTGSSLEKGVSEYAAEQTV